MKTNSKKKIVVSALAIAMGAALVGSISGSVAWYQYSTRTTASMTATSAGTSRDLQIKLADVSTPATGEEAYTGAFEHNLSWTEVQKYLKAKYGTFELCDFSVFILFTSGNRR